MFITLKHALNGTPITLNLAHIVSIRPLDAQDGPGNSQIVIGATSYRVDETHAEIMSEIARVNRSH